jgi:hypothetical protein
MNSFNVNLPQVQGYTPRQKQAAFNTEIARSHAQADPRYNIKPMDKAGMSRGGAQQAMAGISAAQNLADGIAQAYTGQLADNSGMAALSNAQAAGQLGQDMNALALQQQYAALLSRLQRQSDLGSFQGNVLGGLVGNGRIDSFLGF